jgi:hypothetical protein
MPRPRVVLIGPEALFFRGFLSLVNWFLSVLQALSLPCIPWVARLLLEIFVRKNALLLYFQIPDQP